MRHAVIDQMLPDLQEHPLTPRRLIEARDTASRTRNRWNQSAICTCTAAILAIEIGVFRVCVSVRDSRQSTLATPSGCVTHHVS